MRSILLWLMLSAVEAEHGDPPVVYTFLTGSRSDNCKVVGTWGGEQEKMRVFMHTEVSSTPQTHVGGKICAIEAIDEDDPSCYELYDNGTGNWWSLEETQNGVLGMTCEHVSHAGWGHGRTVAYMVWLNKKAAVSWTTSLPFPDDTHVCCVCNENPLQDAGCIAIEGILNPPTEPPTAPPTAATTTAPPTDAITKPPPPPPPPPILNWGSVSPSNRLSPF